MTTRSETGVLVPYYGNGTPRSTRDPHGTATTRDRWAMVIPLRNHNTAKTSTDPLDTVAAAGTHHGLASRAARVEDCEFGDGGVGPVGCSEDSDLLFDAFSRAIVGWPAASSKTTVLVTKHSIWRSGGGPLRSPDRARPGLAYGFECGKAFQRLTVLPNHAIGRSISRASPPSKPKLRANPPVISRSAPTRSPASAAHP